jgi:hypothetical protein
MFGQRQDIELGLLTAFILDMVSEVDYSVGPFVGESYLMWVEKNGNKKIHSPTRPYRQGFKGV